MLIAALEAAVLGLFFAMAGAQPAAAATSWLTVANGYASFSIPADFVSETFGEPTLLVVEGNFGPAFERSEYGLSHFGAAWTGTIGPLPPGSYHYQVTSDDTKTIKDPTNPTTVASQPTWSTFLVPGDAAQLLTDVPAGQGGAVHPLTYPSAGSDRARSAIVWTPPGYDAARTEPYPVLYLLGDESGAPTDWADLGRVPQILDNLAVAGRLTPMVVVHAGGTNPELNALIQAARDKFAIARDPAHQAIAGIATGGSYAVHTALTQPGTFGYVGSFAGVNTAKAGEPGSDTIADVSQADATAVNAGTKLLRLYTGNLTDPAYNPTYHLLQALDKANIRYEFDGVNPAIGANWHTWQQDLADFVPRLFTSVGEHGPTPGHLQLTEEFTTPATGATPWITTDAAGNTFATMETGTDFAAAKHVTLWGNWAPGGSWLRVAMTRHGDRWRSTIGPLKPGFYYYQFIVDLVSKKDTANPTSVTTAPTWSTFLVPGAAARLLADAPAGKGGQVERLTYQSRVAGAQRVAYVWTPPGYDASRAEPYPVLYLQHGSGQSYTDWVEMGRAKQILDNEFLAGDIEPMVVVMGNGNVPDFTTELLDNIVPAARASYHIAHDPARQALAGLSMGGGQTYAVLASHPGEFAYIGTFSAWFTNNAGVDVTAINNGTKLLRIYTGDVTDFVYPFVQSTLVTFDSIGVKYEFNGVTPGPHGWDVWQKNLIDFAPRLFRSHVS